MDKEAVSALATPVDTWSYAPIRRCNFEPMSDAQWKDFTRFMDATVDSTLITACGDLNLKEKKTEKLYVMSSAYQKAQNQMKFNAKVQNAKDHVPPNREPGESDAEKRADAQKKRLQQALVKKASMVQDTINERIATAGVKIPKELIAEMSFAIALQHPESLEEVAATIGMSVGSAASSADAAASSAGGGDDPSKDSEDDKGEDKEEEEEEKKPESPKKET
jgi:ribosomal protein L12E/L44/L45/RPP1/RPP2